MKTENEIDFCKTMLMQPIIQLNINNDDIDLEVIKQNYLKYKQLFYGCVIELLNSFDLKDEEELNYIASNLIDSIIFKSKSELVKALELECIKDDGDIRFVRLGFRAIESLLSNNLASITAKFLCQINASLSPFFFSLKNRDVLLIGYFGYNDYCKGYAS